jgi:hypothetical protein
MTWYPKEVDITSTVKLSEAELTVLDAVTKGTAAANKAVVLGATGKIDTIDVTSLKLGGVAVTASAAQLNALTEPLFVDHVVTVAEVKAGHVVVPAIAGKQFYPTFAAMVATGSVTTSTVISLVESTSAGVVLSHVAADMASGVWAGPTGGTVVTTLLNTALTIGEGIKIVDTAPNSLTVTTAIRVIVSGYYI